MNTRRAFFKTALVAPLAVPAVKATTPERTWEQVYVELGKFKEGIQGRIAALTVDALRILQKRRADVPPPKVTFVKAALGCVDEAVLMQASNWFERVAVPCVVWEKNGLQSNRLPVCVRKNYSGDPGVYDSWSMEAQYNELLESAT